jgi:hypothetical protein
MLFGVGLEVMVGDISNRVTKLYERRQVSAAERLSSTRALQRRPAGQSDGSGNLSATVAADRARVNDFETLCFRN